MHSYIREIPNTSQNYYIFKSTLIPPKKKQVCHNHLRNFPQKLACEPCITNKNLLHLSIFRLHFFSCNGNPVLMVDPVPVAPFWYLPRGLQCPPWSCSELWIRHVTRMTKKQKAHTSVMNFHMKMSQGKWVVKGCQTISLCLSSMIIKNSFKFQNLIYKSSDSLAKLWSNLIISTIPTAWMFSYFSNPYHPRMVYLPTSSWFFWVNLGKYTWILCFPLNDFWPTILKLPN